jgi:hypothetical protein
MASLTIDSVSSLIISNMNRTKSLQYLQKNTQNVSVSSLKVLSSKVYYSQPIQIRRMKTTATAETSLFQTNNSSSRPVSSAQQDSSQLVSTPTKSAADIKPAGSRVETAASTTSSEKPKRDYTNHEVYLFLDQHLDVKLKLENIFKGACANSGLQQKGFLPPNRFTKLLLDFKIFDRDLLSRDVDLVYVSLTNNTHGM